ncbi:MAG: 4Fe-4S ferredoxin [Lentisphaerae bacterium GWF2_45_14]|nr:MAG: 4Fe-4S ferredoxin [Lentisphaerae bacterium GWF2_45_14]
MKRKIILIDKEKCDGCGKCVSACAEGAIQLVNGKAQLVGEVYCDGLGACIGKCPRDAIKIEEREAQAFDEEAVKKHLGGVRGHSCPGSMAFSLGKNESPLTDAAYPSALSQWPVQLRLVPVQAPYWDKADLLITADCVPFAYGDFHRKFLKGRKVVTACPKLDDCSTYVEKLSQILLLNDIRSVTVTHMEVPCCSGIVRMAQESVSASGKNMPLNIVKITISGKTEKRDEK